MTFWAFVLEVGDRITWSTVFFWLMIFLLGWILFRFEKKTEFRIYQFVTTPDGRADKYSLGYIASLLVGTWGMWYLTTTDKLTEWFWTSYIGAFVLGAALKTGAAVAERVKMAQANNPPPQPVEPDVVAEVKTRTTTSTKKK